MGHPAEDPGGNHRGRVRWIKLGHGQLFWSRFAGRRGHSQPWSHLYGHEHGRVLEQTYGSGQYGLAESNRVRIIPILGLCLFCFGLAAQPITRNSVTTNSLPQAPGPAALLFFWPMDTQPNFPTVTVNNFDVDRTVSHFNMDVGGIFYGERTLSYHPNE